MNLIYDKINSPIGELNLIVKEQKIIALMFGSLEKVKSYLEKKLKTKDISLEFKENPENYSTMLYKYFEGDMSQLSLLQENSVLHGTEFQIKSWKQLAQIPTGKTISYEEEARLVGNIKAVRAVALANNKNPIMIIYPCHRVIGKNGHLVGYASGLENKKWLLDHEAKFISMSLV